MHFNVWLDGEYVDPFAARARRASGRTATSRALQMALATTTPVSKRRRCGTCAWSRRRRELQDPATREALRSEADLDQRAMNVLFMRNYYPTRFEGRAPLYRERHAREPWLTLPFGAEDFDGIAFAS